MGLSLTGRKRKDTYTWLLQMQGAGSTLDAETPIVMCFGDGTVTPLSLTTTGLFVGGSAVAIAPILRSSAEGPPDTEVAESILSGNTLTESSSSGTCPVLNRGDGTARPATVNGKAAFYSAGSDWSGLFPTGWRSVWTGTQWKTEYKSASFVWFEATSDDDVASPDLATFDAPTEGTGTPDFALTEAIVPSVPVAIGQECRVGDDPEDPETLRWFKASSISPVVWQELALDADVVQKAPFPVIESTRAILIHDDCSGTNASLADEEDRVLQPGPGTLKVKALPNYATFRYENGELLLYPGTSGTSATATLAASGLTLAAGMTMVVRLVPGNIRGQQSSFFATFSNSYALVPRRGGIEIRSLTSTPGIDVLHSTLANDTDDSWYYAGYSTLNEGEEIALAIHHKTLSHQQYYMQGGRYASLGCSVGSDNWFLIGESFTALSGTVYPMFGTNTAGITRIRDLQILSSWNPGTNSVCHETSRTFKGIHIPYLQKDPVSGLVVQAWNSGLVHYGATANINIKYSTRLADGTWTAAGTLLADGGGDEGNQFCHLSIVAGKLWMVYVPINWATTTVDEGGPIYRREITINASTGAATVGAAVSLGVGTKAMSFSEIVQTDTGRYVLPYQEDSGSTGSGVIKPRFAYSDDDGVTWTTVQVGTGTNPGSSAYFAEQTITKEAAGALGTYIRTADTAWYSRSTDDGVTWSQPTARTEFPMPGSFGCRLNARNLEDGSGAILVGNDHQFQRRNITLWKVDTAGAVVWKKLLGDLTAPAMATSEVYNYTQMQYPNVLFDGSDMLMGISLQHGSNSLDLCNSMRVFSYKSPLQTVPPELTGNDERFKRAVTPRTKGDYKLVYSTAPIPDMSKGRLFHITLTASTAVIGVPLYPLPWEGITLVFVQGGSGSYTATFNAVFEFGNITPAWLTAVGATNTLRGYYNPITAKWVVTSFT